MGLSQGSSPGSCVSVSYLHCDWTSHNHGTESWSLHPFSVHTRLSHASARLPNSPLEYSRPLLILYLVMVSFAFVPLTEFRLPEDQHCLSVLSICISVLGDHPRDDAGLSQALTLLHVENVKARTLESHHAAVFHPLICRGVLRANYTLLQPVACHRIRQRLLFHSAARPVLSWSCTCISWPCLWSYYYLKTPNL